MNDTKLCPMKFNKVAALGKDINCFGEQCAWWIIASKCCALLSLAFDLDNIHRSIQRG